MQRITRRKNSQSRLEARGYLRQHGVHDKEQEEKVVQLTCPRCTVYSLSWIMRAATDTRHAKEGGKKQGEEGSAPEAEMWKKKTENQIKELRRSPPHYSRRKTRRKSTSQQRRR